MSELTGLTGLLPAVRTPPHHPLATEPDRRAYDQYLAARNQYKEEFLDRLEALCDSGPVLEAGPGYGGFAGLLLARRPVDLRVLCTDPGATGLLGERLDGAVPIGYWDTGRPLPAHLAGRHTLVYGVHALGGCTDPTGLLTALAAALAPGGRLLVNDLRRDPDPFILEYTLREMAADDSPEGGYRLRTYLDSLRGAWTCAELRARLDAAGMDDWAVEPDGPMALTVEHHRSSDDRRG
ncbi:methyltransferase domain-containing protein [Kitasatospora aureofaciens]|uniref:methyltransferase domain-containing protein n=1 Tax=Kitasatospora aureofaciens TaxID=1894 RepID=UPI001C46DAFA|nr:methyltransferase domain-containing protein [Kitasatospora aureofaciens]MBV6702053.1 methyltransferase domain-containing protein [Kitasatospora aureofaciens]